jgi:steroid delta-isomerase
MVLRIMPNSRCFVVAAFAVVCSGSYFVSAAAPASADLAADRNAISARLLQWTVAFNERRAADTCAIFAPDLIADVEGAPERGRAAICAQIATALARTDQRMTNAPDIREIIVSGRLAVVRLVWRVTVEHGTTRETTDEPGIDVFRKEPDGTWVIIRYLAYSREVR